MRADNMSTLTVALPWPPKMLSPNARPHWAALAKTKKRYRHACATLALEAGARSFSMGMGGTSLSVHLEFIPPNKRERDEDNLIASCKTLYDGLADALGIDDKHFRLSHSFATKIGGMIKVTVSEAA